MKIAVLTSGGDSPGMNAAVRALVKVAAYKGHQVFGINEGYKGMVENDFIELTPSMVEDYLTISGTFLRSARLPEFQKPEVQAKGVENMKKRGISHLVVVGGDGSYHAASRLDKSGLKVIGLPGTIDNDLGGTDFTIGFYTAQNTITEALDAIKSTAKSHKRCYVLEVMGRACGDLALYGGIAGGADCIVSQDNLLSVDEISKCVKEAFDKKEYALVVITENITNAHELAKQIEEKTSVITRATVLGYMQRGGTPAPQDRVLATRLAGHAIELFEKDIHGVAVGIKGDEVVTCTIDEAISTRRDRKKDYEFAKMVY